MLATVGIRDATETTKVLLHFSHLRLALQLLWKLTWFANMHISMQFSLYFVLQNSVQTPITMRVVSEFKFKLEPCDNLLNGTNTTHTHTHRSHSKATYRRHEPKLSSISARQWPLICINNQIYMI